MRLSLLNRPNRPTYHIFTVSTPNYRDITYVMLHSFYRYNNLPVTVYMINSEPVDFSDFPLVTVKRLDIDTNLKHYAYDLNIIGAKFKIMDESTADYCLTLDGDMMFFGSIADALIDYSTSIAGVNEPILNKPKVLNAGFLIVKRHSKSLYNIFKAKYREYLLTPEQDVISAEFLNDMTEIDSKYNTTFSTNLFKTDDLRCLHFAITVKPWSVIKDVKNYERMYYPQSMLLLSIQYIDYAIELNVSPEFKQALQHNRKIYTCLLGNSK